MIPTCHGFKACWLKKKILLSPMFGFDTLSLTKGKVTGHKLGVYYKKHSRTKSLLSRKLRTTFLHSTSGRLLMKQRKYASLYFSKYTLVFF